MGAILMTYAKTDALRHKVLETIVEAKQECHRLHPPAYKAVCRKLKERGVTTGYGKQWSPRTLYAFLWRSGYSGVHGVIKKTKVI